MDNNSNCIKLRVTSPEGIQYEANIRSLHIKSIDGELTILPKHFPLLTNVVISICHFIEDNNIVEAYVGDGIMHVSENMIELIVEAFTLKNDIDIERARKAKERAEERLNSLDPSIDKIRAHKALVRAEARISLWEKK